MRSVSLLLASIVGGWVGLHAAIAATPSPFPQETRVVGKAPADLGGAWFLYAQAQFTAGKSRALPPQLITATPGGEGGLQMKVLDVQLPKSIYEPYQNGNRQPQAWEPTPQDVALLRKEWAKLPPATDKDWRKSEKEYERVEFTVVSPDKYAEAFADQSSEIHQAIDGSPYALVISEHYRPHPVPAGENVAQALLRKTIYVVRKRSDSLVEGKQFTGYVAAGAGVPLPINTSGPFRLYRLAKGKGNASAPATSKQSPSHPGKG